MQSIPARWFTKAGSSRPRQFIVLHSMEAPDKGDMAAQVGLFFQNLPITRKASAHVGVDSGQRVRYVDDDDVAYGAPGLNHSGLHVEMTGYAKYSRGEWEQPRMMVMIQNTAQQIKEWHQRYLIPLRFVNAEELRRYEPHDIPPDSWGITTHAEVSKAWGKTDHWDPGPNFPVNTLLAMVRSPDPEVIEEESEVAPYIHVERQNGPGYWLIKPSDGGVFAYDGAPYLKSLPELNVKPLAPIVDAASTPSGNGYYLLGADGGVFCFGDAEFTDSYAGHPEWQQGSRVFVGIQPLAEGYQLISTELNADGSLSDPPRINKYDLGKKR